MSEQQNTEEQATANPREAVLDEALQKIVAFCEGKWTQIDDLEDLRNVAAAALAYRAPA